MYVRGGHLGRVIQTLTDNLLAPPDSLPKEASTGNLVSIGPAVSEMFFKNIDDADDGRRITV